MSTLEYVSIDDAVVLAVRYAKRRGLVGRVPGVHPNPVNEQWITLDAALNDIEGSTDRYWMTNGLVVHTSVRIVPGINVDVSYLYFFEPPQNVLDQLEPYVG